MQSCLGLQFDVKVGNANTMMLNWDASVCGRGGGGGGKRCQKYYPNKRDLHLTEHKAHRMGLVSRQACIQRQLSVEED